MVVVVITKASRQARQSRFGERSEQRGSGGWTLPYGPKISKLGSD